MCKNSNRIYFLLVLFIFIITPNIVRAQDFEFLRGTEIINIGGRKYYPAVKEVLDKSEKSIFVVMYIVSMDERNAQSEVYQLCKSLVDAKGRGVKVKVILDQSIDYERSGDGNGVRIEGKNQNAFKYFKENGVEVVYDTKTVYTHSKTIIVDENVVVLGSTNWSGASLNKNNEASILIRSKELAGSLAKDFSEIVIDSEAGGDEKEKEPSLALYRIFLENENLAGRHTNIPKENILYCRENILLSGGTGNLVLTRNIVT